jgi:hypothetical protein
MKRECIGERGDSPSFLFLPLSASGEGFTLRVLPEED